MPLEFNRPLYARLCGPTVSGRVRLGDTNLLSVVERHDTQAGEELVWGFGMTIRDPAQMSSHHHHDSTRNVTVYGRLVAPAPTETFPLTKRYCLA